MAFIDKINPDVPEALIISFDRNFCRTHMGQSIKQITKFGASPPSLTAENPVVFSEHHHPKTLKTL